MARRSSTTARTQPRGPCPSAPSSRTSLRRPALLHTTRPCRSRTYTHPPSTATAPPAPWRLRPSPSAPGDEVEKLVAHAVMPVGPLELSQSLPGYLTYALFPRQ